MSLREDLARRLVQVVLLSNGGVEGPEPTIAKPGEIAFSRVHDPDTFPLMSSFDFLPLADEVLRQMEWARRHNVTVMAEHPEWLKETRGPNHPCPMCGSTPTGPLTLAPDGWAKPQND
jgi:hypothetical protein